MRVDPRIQLAAERLLYRYQLLVDQKDLDGLAEILTDDAVLVRQDGRRTGREAVLDLYRQFAASDVEIANHMATNVLVAPLELGRWQVDSSFLAFTIHASREARMTWGRYRDVMVQADDRWLLASKHIAISRTVELDAAMTFDPTLNSFADKETPR